MDDNYAKRLRSVRDMEESDMGKFKHLFAAFGPKINQSMIKYFCEERLKGNDFLWCSDLNAHLVDTYRRYVYYSLSPNFREISKALFLLIHMLPSIQKPDK